MPYRRGQRGIVSLGERLDGNERERTDDEEFLERT
jgi:hypothetical protein